MASDVQPLSTEDGSPTDARPGRPSPRAGGSTERSGVTDGFGRRLRRLALILVTGGVLVSAGIAYRDWQLPRLAAQRLARQIEAREASLETAVRDSPNNLNARLELSEWRAANGRAPEAEQELRAALRIDPGHRESWLRLSRMLTEQRRFADALQANREIIRRWPDDPTGYAAAAICYRQLDELAAALSHARLALKHNPDPAASRYLVGALALEYAEQGATVDDRENEYALAQKMLEPVVRAAPDNWDAALRLARACKALDQDEPAERYLRQALDVNPTSAEALDRLADLKINQGKYTDAAAVAERFTASHPTDPRAHFQLGTALLHHSDAKSRQRAVTVLSEAVRLAPDRPAYHQQLGVALIRANRAAEARRPFEIALRLNPVDPFPLQQLAAVFTKMGDPVNASLAARDATRLATNRQRLKYYQAQSRLYPNVVPLHMILADRYRELGWTTQARDEYRAVLRIQPSNKQAAAGLKSLTAPEPDHGDHAAPGSPGHDHAPTTGRGG